MSKPTLLGCLLVLAACSQPAAEAPSGEALECALDGAATFALDCRVTRTIVPGGSAEIVRHPDGGFRRFEIEGDQVRTADGADAAQSRVTPDAIEVTVGDDRYRFLPPALPANAQRP